MFSVLTSVSRSWRLFMAGTLTALASVLGAHAGFFPPGGDPPLLSTLQLESGSGPIGFAPAVLSPAFESDINSIEYDINIPFEHSTVQIAFASTVDPFHEWLQPSIPEFSPGATTSFEIEVVDDLFLPSQVTKYTINVTRGTSNNVAALSNLIASGTALSPSFAPLTFDYSGTVPNSTSSITITPTAQSPATSTITVDGPLNHKYTVASGVPSPLIDLSEGTNEIVVLVNDGDVTKAYIISIDRLPPKTDSDNDGMEDGFESANGLTVGINDANLDLDGDGLINIGEYAFGSDPDDASDTNAPVVTRNAGGFLVITFNRAIPPTVGSYQVQVSSDLTNWLNQVTEEPESTLEIPVWRDTAGGSPTPPAIRFIRVLFNSSL